MNGHCSLLVCSLILSSGNVGGADDDAWGKGEYLAHTALLLSSSGELGNAPYFSFLSFF